jgi:hypothetical protein
MKAICVVFALLALARGALGERLIPSRLDSEHSADREKAFVPWSDPEASSIYWEILSSSNVPIYNERRAPNESRDIYIPNPGVAYWVLGGLSEAELWKVERAKLKIGDELVSASLYQADGGKTFYWALWVPGNKAYLVTNKMRELGITPARAEAAPDEPPQAASATASFPRLLLESLLAAWQHSLGPTAEEKLKATTDEYSRWCALGAAAKESVETGHDADAKAHAEELERWAPKYRHDWNYGNAIQDLNIVLGRLALEAGDMQAADNYLLAAGHSPGSPQMDSFGPNMSLAKELLAKGQTDVVFQYFELCRKFWEMDYGKLDEWKRDVGQGRTPDFGANLLY